MGHKILVIDDDDDIADNTKRILSYEGFEVITSDRVEDGLKKIEKDNPDLVLLDIMFPEGKTLGFEAALDIKKIRPDLPAGRERRPVQPLKSCLHPPPAIHAARQRATGTGFRHVPILPGGAFCKQGVFRPVCRSQTICV